MRECEIYYKELANMILEADESQIHCWEGSWEGDFPGSAMAKTPRSQCRDPGSITVWSGTVDPMLFPSFGFQMFNYDVSCTAPVWVHAWRQGKIDVSTWTPSGRERTNSPLLSFSFIWTKCFGWG